MNTQGYIGIDFGTSNSHFAYATITDGEPRAEPIVLGNRPSNATCVLWRKPAQAEQNAWLYGDEAVEEWLLTPPEERKDLHFSASFKPDIVNLQRARVDAKAYLRKAYLEMLGHRTPANIGKDNGVPVVVGVPAEVTMEHKEITAKVAEEAGFGDVECVPEPLGALAYHLAHGQIKDDEAHEGVIVVDFGGGTLDVTLVDKTGVREPWGSPILGGRLFDDLFFQWVLEKNPKVDQRGFTDEDLFSGWHCGCRELKENFSRHWKRHESSDNGFKDFRGRAPLAGGETLGMLKVASLEEFKDRAQAYQPSDMAKRYFKEVGGDLTDLGSDQAVNLFDRIRGALSDNGRVNKLERGYSLVVLTGGSSGWPFMKQFAIDVFGVPEDRVISSANPEATIGEGLAIYNVVRYRQQKMKSLLESERKERTKALGREIDKKLKGFATNVSKTVSTRLMQEVRPIYRDWYHKGGPLQDVEQKMKGICSHFDPSSIAREQSVQLQNDIAEITVNYVRDWLRQHGVNVESQKLDLAMSERTTDITASQHTNIAKLVAGEISENFTGVIATVAGIVGAMISGGGGMALIATGPIGLIVGAAIAAGAVLGLKDEIAEKVKAHSFQGLSLTALHQFVSEKQLNQKLDEVEEKLRSSMTDKIVKDMKANKDKYIQYVDGSVDRVLKKLSILE